MPPDARQKMIGQFAAKHRAAKKRGDTRTYHSEDPAVARKILYGKGSLTPGPGRREGRQEGPEEAQPVH